jgi:hypothetical protein
MKAVKRWRYYCDFCKKAGNSGFHLAKHEKSCTLNPQRECGHCAKRGTPTTPMADMLALLPDPSSCMSVFPGESYGFDREPDRTDFDSVKVDTALSTALPALRELTENCPTCILAAFRQKGIPLPLVSDFNYSEELKAFWNEANDREHENEPAIYGRMVT